MIKQSTVEETYDRLAGQYAGTKYKTIIDDFGRLCIADLLQPNITVSDETQVLELAAGEGNFSRDLAGKLGAGTFWVTDLSSRMLQLAEKTLTSMVGFKYKQLNALKLEECFSPGSMDLVIFKNSEVYFDENEKIQLFKQIYKVLKPGGYFLYGPTSFGEDFTSQLYVPKEWTKKIFLAYWARYMLSSIKSRHLCEEKMLIDLRAENFTFEDKTVKKYDWNINNYSELKNEISAGIQARLSLAGYNLFLFKLLSRFIVPYPYNIIANQVGYLLKKAGD